MVRLRTILIGLFIYCRCLFQHVRNLALFRNEYHSAQHAGAIHLALGPPSLAILIKIPL